MAPVLCAEVPVCLSGPLHRAFVEWVAPECTLLVGSAGSLGRSAVGRAVPPEGSRQGQLYLQDGSATRCQADRPSDRDLAATVNLTFAIGGPLTLPSSQP